MDAPTTSAPSETTRHVGVGQLPLTVPPAKSGVGLIPAAVPWERILEAFLNTHLDSPVSVRSYRHQCSRGLQSIGVTSLDQLTGELLGEYRAEVIGDPTKAPASKASALDTLRSFLKWAGEFGAHSLDDRVVNKCLKSPTVSVVNPYRTLKGTEPMRLWAVAARRPVAYALVCVCLGAGLRVSEIAALRVEDCHADLEGGPAIHVRHGKGGKDRVVPMIGIYFDGITAYLEATGRDLSSRGPVFVANDRARFSRDNLGGITTCGLSHMLRKVLDEAGVDRHRRSIHALRHQFALGVLRQSGNLVAVQKLLGHASPKTSTRYTDHLEVGDLRSALPGYVATAPAPVVSYAPPCPPPAVPEPTLTSREAAAILGISAQMVLYHWHQGRLQGELECGVLRLDPLSVDGLLVDWRTQELHKADAIAAKVKAREAARRPLLERREREAALKAEAQSIHAIARAVGVDRATVQADLAVMLGQRLGPSSVPN
ncbi:MAG TPA: tyrosine-type recombinase/integrase [Candidatus Saccharimonadales bacterium]|nr:tyrosine-type recombinase/integrase [Candidatus Saccharimonadales bacterium]